ncbi:MAG: 6,7-dimethyl-8-ribityllumazine synthase [Deltaproteobacteria bacterium]|nr:6,7-dimethyl-8-ribityllumazine synthase [Deltaproteobacteria bacterium]
MASARVVEGNLIATGLETIIIASRFNGFIVEKLVEGALDALVRHGADASKQTVVWVPGAWEIPLAAQVAIAKRPAKNSAAANFGVVAVGCVIRGSTGHYEHVAGEVQKGIAHVSWQTGVPVGNGVLTVESLEQAIERAGTKMGNKGAEAALAVVEMVNVLKGLG